MPPGPYVALQPRPTPAAPVRAEAGVIASAPAAAVRRDTAALESQARRYVRRPDSKPEVINELSVLLLQTTRAVSRMEGNRMRKAYRASDVIAARVSADALAAFLQVQARP